MGADATAQEKLEAANTAFRKALSQAEATMEAADNGNENDTSVEWIPKFRAAGAAWQNSVQSAWSAWNHATNQLVAAPKKVVEESVVEKKPVVDEGAVPAEKTDKPAALLKAPEPKEEEMVMLTSAIQTAINESKAELSEEVNDDIAGFAREKDVFLHDSKGKSEADCVPSQHYLSYWDLEHFWLSRGCFTNNDRQCANYDWLNYSCKECRYWAYSVTNGSGKKWCALRWWVWLCFYLWIIVSLVFLALVVMAIMKCCKKSTPAAKSAKGTKGYKELHDVELTQHRAGYY